MDEVEQLRKEKQFLEEENIKLKNILKQFGYNYADENLILDKDQRLEIFLNYFKGRKDVYANKYYHQKKKKYEYSFVCSNKFKSNICSIKNKKPCTAECPYFSPIPLTKNVLLMHMQQSNHVVGIYPLLEDDTCYLLAMDFDDDMWFENLLSVYRVTKKYSISSVMERSQSGNGGHLWIFFANKVKASKARQLGDFLLKEAMKSNKHLKFNSFDRMFPSQDYLSGHGLGNLIALPLQADAINNGNSLFINEYEQPIRKPFHYLSSIVKIDEIQVDQILNSDGTSFKDYFDSSTTLHLLNQINQSMEVKEDSLLTISKKGLSSKTLLTIRKIASVYNPDYFEKLRLHLSVYKTPRVLCEYIEDDYTISIPRGLKNKLFEYIDSDLLIYEDHRSEGKPIEISFMGSLWNNQEEAITSLMNHDIAMLEAIPGFGKTVLALNIMATLKRSTLIIVNNKELLDQWKEKIDQFIDYPKAKLKRDHFIGEYHGSKKRLKYNIDIALIQSLSHLEDLSVLKNYGLVLIDECHHASSETYRTVLQNLNAKYIYSFSGTPQRKDKKDKIITMYLGDIVYKTNKKEIIENRSYEQILIPRITTFKVVDQDVSYGELCNQIYLNKKRNHLIIQDVVKEIKEQKNIIILTDRKEHIQILYEQLRYFDNTIYCMSGETSLKERKEIREKISKDDHYLIIATSQLIGEGFDLPSLNTMFITMPISFEGRLTQYVGRLHRDYQNKESVVVYDYIDANIRVLDNMFQKRLRTYKKEGYKMINNQEMVEFNEVVFDKANYEYYLNASMQQAKKSIVIFANDCRIQRIQRIYHQFISLLAKGIKVYICIHKSYEPTIHDYLNEISTHVLSSSNSMNAILIDEEQLWISSSSYLGIQYNNLYYLKTNDTTIIEELKNKII